MPLTLFVRTGKNPLMDAREMLDGRAYLGRDLYIEAVEKKKGEK